MKKWLVLFCLPILLLGFIRLRLDNKPATGVRAGKENRSLGCSPYSPENTAAAVDGKWVTALPGWGRHVYSVSTVVDSTQFYFNQGLNMYYSYHFKEARASFKEAARLDPGCAMAYWGQALAMGPNYNSARSYQMPGEVSGVLRQMNQPGKQATEKEKRIIDVMNLRYSDDSTDLQRPALNMAYARGLRELITRYPADPEIKIWFIDAVMLIHPWDFWNNNGSAKEWTPEIINLCKAVLKENPEHPAALHYYIHLTEASRHPEVALHAADQLKDLLPGVAHMVHMSSHEYERNGFYAQGVAANDRADDDLIHYDSLAKNLHLAQHVPHYFAVQAYCALSGGMYEKGFADAVRCSKSVTPSREKTYLQYLYMMPSFARVRLGKWAELLQDHAEPDAQWSFASLLYDFARGMAFVNSGQPDSAAGRLLLLRKSKDSVLALGDTLSNKPSQVAEIAGEILQASIFFRQKKYAAAIAHIQKGIQLEDSLLYTEPKDWLIPARQYLGAFYLRLGKPAMAEKIYRDDLVWNPGNGWSLLGLYQSLRAQHKQQLLAGYKAKYLRSFSGADHIPPGSVYMN